MTRRVSDVEAIRVDITGPEAFGDPASGKDLFTVVGNVAAHVGNQAALTTDLADLDKVIAGITKAAADIGTRAARMDNADAVNSARR